MTETVTAQAEQGSHEADADAALVTELSWPMLEATTYTIDMEDGSQHEVTAYFVQSGEDLIDVSRIAVAYAEAAQDALGTTHLEAISRALGNVLVGFHASASELHGADAADQFICSVRNKVVEAATLHAGESMDRVISDPEGTAHLLAYYSGIAEVLAFMGVSAAKAEAAMKLGGDGLHRTIVSIKEMLAERGHSMADIEFLVDERMTMSGETGNAGDAGDA
jgi:hypothetical protein